MDNFVTCSWLFKSSRSEGLYTLLVAKTRDPLNFPLGEWTWHVRFFHSLWVCRRMFAVGWGSLYETKLQMLRRTSSHSAFWSRFISPLVLGAKQMVWLVFVARSPMCVVEGTQIFESSSAAPSPPRDVCKQEARIQSSVWPWTQAPQYRM